MGRRVPTPSATYEARCPAQRVLHQIVLDHFETFRAGAASLRDGEGLPRFVEQEFRDFLSCGCLASGFARFHCDGCGLDRLVPFSCKGRGFVQAVAAGAWLSVPLNWSIMCSPTCRCAGRGPRRAVGARWGGVGAEPPYRLRYLLAWDHDLCRAVVGVYARALLGFLRQRARRDGITDGRSG